MSFGTMFSLAKSRPKEAQNKQRNLLSDLPKQVLQRDKAPYSKRMTLSRFSFAKNNSLSVGFLPQRSSKSCFE